MRVKGRGADLAEFVQAEWVVLMMSVPLNKVAAMAILALFSFRFSPKGGHPAMGYNPTKPPPTQDRNSSVFQELGRVLQFNPDVHSITNR
jgi:hypothetical protein